MDSKIVSREVWEEIRNVLMKHKIDYSVKDSFVGIYKNNVGTEEEPDFVVTNKHIQIKLTVLDYYGDKKAKM